MFTEWHLCSFSFSWNPCFTDPHYPSWASGGAEKGGHFLKATCLGGAGSKAWRSRFPDWWSLPRPAASLFRPFYIVSSPFLDMWLQIPMQLSGLKSLRKPAETSNVTFSLSEVSPGFRGRSCSRVPVCFTHCLREKQTAKRNGFHPSRADHV